MTQGELVAVRPGRHDCYDRVVFDVTTHQDVQFMAGYVPVVLQDASGKPVPVAGSAALRVVIKAPTSGQFAGYDYVANWNGLKEVKAAGSFEGVTTFALGVGGKRPFAATTWQEGDTLHVIIDIFNQ